MICPADIEQLSGYGNRNYSPFIHPVVENRNLSLFKAWRRYPCKALFILNDIRLFKNLAYIQAISTVEQISFQVGHPVFVVLASI